MGDAYFYHLTDSPLEIALPMLIGKARQAGWKVVVRGREAEHIKWLDEKLWLGPDESFEPHGIAGGSFDADQPVLLTTGSDVPNDATCLMCVDGTDVTAEETGEMDRACVIFDGHNADAVAHARTQWKALTDAGVTAQYWAQESGRWTKKAES